MDQHEEQEMEDRSEGRRKEEEEYKAAAEEERSSDEESTAASSLFVHPCSLLQYLVRACACCLGMQDSFGGMKPSAAAPAHTDSSREEGEADNKTSDTGFYMQEVITRVWAVRRPRPPPPDKPREGSGGNGGHHH